MKLQALSAAFLLSLTPVWADRTLSIVAHPDDDFLFLNPDILHDINSGFTVRSIYLTAGDAGHDWAFWTSRQAGALAAYAEMAGTPNEWDESDAGVKGKNIPLYTLRHRPEISLAFMHLPDGNMDGSGFPLRGNESLEKLWKGKLARIRAVDDSGTTYSKIELVESLRQLIDGFGPDRLNSLNYIDSYGSGDHSDHTSAGIFANEAAVLSGYSRTVIAYRGYTTKNQPVNVVGEDLAAKKDTFYTYAAFDPSVCASDKACVGTEYEQWLTRLYTAN